MPANWEIASFSVWMSEETGTEISIDHCHFLWSSRMAYLAIPTVLASYGTARNMSGWDYGAEDHGYCDDIFITSGAASQQVDEIVGRGLW